MRGIVEDLHVQYGREPAESLRPDAEGVDLVVNLNAQRFEPVFRSTRPELVHVDGIQ